MDITQLFFFFFFCDRYHKYRDVLETNVTMSKCLN